MKQLFGASSPGERDPSDRSDPKRTGKATPGSPFPAHPYQAVEQIESAQNGTAFYTPEELRDFFADFETVSPQIALKKQFRRAKTVTLLGQGRIPDTVLSGPEFAAVIQSIADDRIRGSVPERLTASEIFATLAPGGFEVLTQDGTEVRFKTIDFLHIAYHPKIQLGDVKFSLTDPKWIDAIRSQFEVYKSANNPARISIKDIHWYETLGKFFAHHRPGAKAENDEFNDFMSTEAEFRTKSRRLNLKTVSSISLQRVRKRFWAQTLANYDKETTLTPEAFIDKYEPHQPLGIEKEEFLPALLLKLKETGRTVRGGSKSEGAVPPSIS